MQQLSKQIKRKFVAQIFAIKTPLMVQRQLLSDPAPDGATLVGLHATIFFLFQSVPTQVCLLRSTRDAWNNSYSPSKS